MATDDEQDVSITPWQTFVLDTANCGPQLHWVFDRYGDYGKSPLCDIIRSSDHGFSHKTREVQDFQQALHARLDTNLGILVLDLKRSTRARHLREFAAICEALQHGRYRSWTLDPPPSAIWIFSGHIPPPNRRSNKHWHTWYLNSDGNTSTLVKYSWAKRRRITAEDA